MVHQILASKCADFPNLIIHPLSIMALHYEGGGESKIISPFNVKQVKASFEEAYQAGSSSETLCKLNLYKTFSAFCDDKTQVNRIFLLPKHWMFYIYSKSL